MDAEDLARTFTQGILSAQKLPFLPQAPVPNKYGTGNEEWVVVGQLAGWHIYTDCRFCLEALILLSADIIKT